MLPVARKAPKMGDGDNNDFTLPKPVHDLAGEARQEHPSGVVLSGNRSPVKWCALNEMNFMGDHVMKLCAKARGPSFVPSDGCAEFPGRGGS